MAKKKKDNLSEALSSIASQAKQEATKKTSYAASFGANATSTKSNENRKSGSIAGETTPIQTAKQSTQTTKQKQETARQVIQTQKQARTEQKQKQRTEDGKAALVLQDKIKNTTDRRAKAAYQQELLDLKYPLSDTEKKYVTNYADRKSIQENRKDWNEAHTLSLVYPDNKELQDSCNRIMELSHIANECTRARYGFSGGDSGGENLRQTLSEAEQKYLNTAEQEALARNRAFSDLFKKYNGDDRETIDKLAMEERYFKSLIPATQKIEDAHGRTTTVEGHRGKTNEDTSEETEEELYLRLKYDLADTPRNRLEGERTQGYTSRDLALAREVYDRLKETYDRPLSERISNTAKGAAYQLLGSYAETLGQYLNPDSESTPSRLSRYTMEGDAEAARAAQEEAQARQNAADRLYAYSTHMLGDGTQENSGAAQDALNEAKTGLGGVGRFLVDAGAAGAQMVPDLLLNTAAPGLGLTNLGTRSFGLGANEARNVGAGDYQQLLYGLGSAATEVLSEKMVGAFQNTYGEGVLDHAMKKAIQKFVKNDTAASVVKDMAGEGLEEVVASAVNPILRSVYNGKTPNENYSDETLSEWLYEGLVGAALGGVGSGVSLANQTLQTISGTKGSNTGVPSVAGESAKRFDNTPPEYALPVSDKDVEAKSMRMEQEQDWSEPTDSPVDIRNMATTTAAPGTPTPVASRQSTADATAQLQRDALTAQQEPQSSLVATLANAANERAALLAAAQPEALQSDSESLPTESRLPAMAQQEARENGQNAESVLSSQTQNVPLQAEQALANQPESVVQSRPEPRTAAEQAVQRNAGQEQSEPLQADSGSGKPSVARSAVDSMGEAGKSSLDVASRLGVRSGTEEDFVSGYATVYYESLANQKNIAKPDSLSEAQYLSAVEAGQKDRAANLEALRAKASSVTTYRPQDAGFFDDSGSVDADTAKELDSVSKILGVRTVMADSVAGGSANAELSNGTILLERGNPNPVRSIFGHETGHRIRELSPDSWQNFQNYVASIPGKQAEVEKKIRLYARHGVKLSADEAMEEVACDYAGQLAEDRNALQKFIADNRQNKSLLQRVADALKSFVARLTGKRKSDVETAIDLLSKAAKAAGVQARENGKSGARTISPMEVDPSWLDAGMADYPRYSLVEDKETLERLSNAKTVIRYRAAQEVNGKFYSPMAGKVDGRWTKPIEFNQWEQADERPETAHEKPGEEGSGRFYFTLDKGNGSKIEARYNPYVHSSTLMLNDQFSSAYKRPELVVLEVEVPQFEIDEPYKAEKAKDATGNMSWHTGPVASRLPAGKSRVVTLSRYDKPIRKVKDSEVAKFIADYLAGENIPFPSNVVTPNLRKELETLGVRITEGEAYKAEKEAFDAAKKAEKKAKKKAGKFSLKEIDGRLMPVVDTKNDTRDSKAAEVYLKTLVDTENPFSTVLEDSQPVYIGKDLPGEYRWSKYTNGMKDNLRKAKMQSATNLDEMILIAQNGEWRENVKEKHRIDAENGWYRYDTEFAVPVFDAKKNIDHYTIYGSKLLVRNDRDGKSYLYDMLNVEEKKKVISSLPSTAKKSGQVYSSQNPLFDRIPRSTEQVNPPEKFSLKKRQFESIQKENPAEDDIHTWIRTEDDILTYDEATEDFSGEDITPDYTAEMVERAKETGEITVFSSKPIKTGVFVTPSRMEADNYAGGGKVYEKTVKLDDVAWIDEIQGQYAAVHQKFSLKSFPKETLEDGIQKAARMSPVSEITGEEISMDGGKLLEQVSRLFQSAGGKVQSRQLGEVLLTKRGVKADLSHGMGPEKAKSFAAVPNVVEKGYVVDFQKNWKGRQYDTATIAAPITISGKDYIAGVVLKRKSGESRFYVHEVIKKDSTSPFLTRDHSKTSVDTGGDVPSVNSVLQRILEVKVNGVEGAKFSLKGTGDYNTAKLERQNKLLRERMEYWKSQTRRTKLPTSNPQSVKKAARRLLKAYSSEAELESVTESLQALYDGISRGEAFEESDRKAREVAETIAREAVTEDSGLYDDYADLRKFFKETKLTVTVADKAGIPDYKDWRNANRKYFNLSIGEHTNVDAVFQEAAVLWPEWFDEQKTGNIHDQLEELSNVLSTIYTVTAFNPYSDNMESAIEGIANDILYEYFEIPQIKTFADKQAEKWKTAKEKGKKEKEDAVLAHRIAEERRVRATDRKWAERLEKSVKKNREELDRIREENRVIVNQAILAERMAGGRELARYKREIATRDGVTREKQKCRELRGKITRHLSKLSKKLLLPNDKQHIQKGLEKVVAALLDAVNLESKGGKPTKRTEAFHRLRDVYENILRDPEAEGMIVDPDLAISITEIAGWKDTSILELDSGQLTKIYNVIRMVETSVQNADQVFRAGRYQKIRDLADGIRLYTGHIRDRRELRIGGSVQNLLTVSMLTPEAYFHRLGDAGDDLFRMLRGAQDAQIRILHDARTYTREKAGKTKIRKLEQEVKKYKVGGEEVELSTAQIMNLYLLSKRKHALDHIHTGGIRPTTIDEGIIIRQ